MDGQPEPTGWVAPDAAAGSASPPGAATGSPLDSGPTPTTPTGPAAPPAPAAPTSAAALPLRPMTAADILDGGFAILKANPRRIVSIVAVFVVPVQILAAYSQRDVFREQGFIGALNEAFTTGTTQTGSSDAGLAFLATALSWLLLPFVAGALAALVWAWYAGGDLTAGEALAAAGRRWWALLIGCIGVHAAEAVGLLGLGIGALVFMAFFVVTAPAIVLEQLGPFAGMGRSWSLVARRFFPCLGIAILIGIVASLFSQVIGSVGLLLTDLPYGWVMNAAIGSAAALLTTPVVAGATVLLYFDLRIRTEGLDIELGAMQHLDRALAP